METSFFTLISLLAIISITTHAALTLSIPHPAFSLFFLFFFCFDVRVLIFFLGSCAGADQGGRRVVAHPTLHANGMLLFPAINVNDSVTKSKAGALVHVYTDGTILVTHGGVEIGQGLHTKLAQIAASSFNIPLGSVFISDTSTDKGKYGLATRGRKGTLSEKINSAPVSDVARDSQDPVSSDNHDETRRGYVMKASPDPELKKYIEKSRSFAGVSVDPKVFSWAIGDGDSQLGVGETGCG